MTTRSSYSTPPAPPCRTSSPPRWPCRGRWKGGWAWRWGSTERKSCEHVSMKKAALLLLLLSLPAFAADEFTLYELLPPETHQFAITYDVTQDREGATLFFNPIRPGSIATKERVIARADGKDLPFEVVSGK